MAARSRTASLLRRILAIPALLTLLVGVVPGGRAFADGPLFYGPADAHVFGDPDPKAPPVPLGFCVPISMLAASHIGLHWVMAQRGRLGSIRYGFDATVSLRCGRSLGGNPHAPGLVVLPQLGYSFDQFERGGVARHFFRFGAGVGYGNAMATLAYAPRFLIGAEGGLPIQGFRHGLILSFASDILTVEASQQLTFAAGRSREADFRVGGSVNFLLLFYALAR